MAQGFITRSGSDAKVTYELTKPPDGKYEIRTTPLESLSVARSNAAIAQGKKYLVVAGGLSGTTYLATADAYDEDGTRVALSDLSLARSDLGGAKNDNYIIFGGGKRTSSAYSNVTDAYDQDTLTRTTATVLSAARGYLEGIDIGVYALMCGGVASSRSAVVNAYNGSLTLTTATALSVARYRHMTARTENHAFIMGGISGSTYYATVDTYDASLTHTVADVMSVTRCDLGSATALGEVYAVCGLRSGAEYSGTVDKYTDDLVHTVITDVFTPRSSLAAAEKDGWVLAVGGVNGDGVTARIEALDAETGTLAHSAFLDVPARDLVGATSAGGDARFFGGLNSAGAVDAAVQIEKYAEATLLIPQGAKYAFGSDSEVKAAEQMVLTLSLPASGYVKYQKGTFIN